MQCWAANRLSHHSEPSGRAVHEEVDGLDIGGQHGRRCDPLRHTHKPQKWPCPSCTNNSRNVQRRCGGDWAGPTLSVAQPGIFVQRGSITWCTSDCSFRLSTNNGKLVWNTSENLSKFVSEGAMASSASFWLRYCTLFSAVPFQESGSGMKVRSLVVLSNLSAFHPLLFLSSDKLMSCWAAGMKWVSIWDAVHSHSMDRRALSGADVKVPWDAVLETLWLHCNEVQ